MKPSTACLEDVYGDENGRGVYADIEPLFMIRPARCLSTRYVDLRAHIRGSRTYLLGVSAT